MENLMQGLFRELNRNRELLDAYRKAGEIGGSNVFVGFGVAAITADIAAAEKAIGEGDTIAMLKCYDILKNNK